ncbi:MAG TPA: PP2C family protein-serine/threonine phosphatase [Terriglobales bacterium]|nr:PP2C family protein-serine/threonine phosphatase [Terriglobales bacterium]
MKRFWHRISDGIAIEELWRQLRRDTTSSYQLYARDAQVALSRQVTRKRHRGSVVEFLWAIVLKMSPPRRVVLLVAVVLLFTTWLPVGVLLILGLLALEVADRVAMKRDLEIAREIQTWMLPKEAPALPGAAIAFANLPANTVSGDFYDAFYRADQLSLLLTVADVAGKGLPAAMLMATFQASLRTLAGEGVPLADLTPALNRYACGASAGGTRFTTAVVAEFEPASGRLRYSNAGHNPPLLLRSNGLIERLELGGVPLGILSEAGFDCAETVLAPGDVLVIFSDGMTESFSETGEEYGEARLIASLQRARALTAIPLLNSLLADCSSFRGGARQQDDLTCLVLKLA